MAVAMGHPEWSIDPRFARAERWNHRAEMDAALDEFLSQHDADEVVAILQQGGVACAKVAGARDIADNPQLQHRGYWEQVPGGGVMPGYPLRVFHEFGKSPLPLAGSRRRREAPAAGGGPVAAAERGFDMTHPPLTPPASGRGTLPLAGIKVLDFTIFWAGPSAARTLADLGADVIWAEQPGSREDTELEPGKEPSPWDLMQHLYATKMYRGKRSIHLDLTKPGDRAIAHALAKEADVVLENYRPGVADKLGIGPRELAAINPGLVYVSLSGWGASGPWAHWRSYGPSIEAASSIEGRTGYVGGDPLRLGHAFPDANGGLAGALAALRGLRRRCEGAPGGWFDVSQLEVYSALAGEGILEATRYGRGIELVGNRSRFGALQGVFRCRGEDQWIGIRLDGADDEHRFEQATGIAAEEAAIAVWTPSQDKHDLAARLQAAGLEAFPALDAHELLADPHLAARGYFLDVEVGERSYKVPGTPLVATPPMADPAHPAPRPGEHSDSIRRNIEALAT
jgi:crotonobetainyl-CoA:carnitine CoA-transferase CaiB-like acyl-CoA transferase